MCIPLTRFRFTRFAAAAVLLAIVSAVTESACSQQYPTSSLTVVATGTAGSTGTITIAFNGLSESVSYGQYSTPASIASAFGAEFSQDPISALPSLCTRGVCAKADGAKIVFQLLQPGATFGSLTVISPNNPFSINASAWPTAGATQIGVFCNPSEIVVGETTDCTASLPAGTVGTVNFTVDGGSSQTASIDSNGDATITDVLQGGAAGTHVVTATYSPSGSAPVSGIELVVIDANPSAPGAPAGPVYSYNITNYAANSNILAYTDSVTGTWSSISYDTLNRLALATQTPQPVQGTAQPMQYTCWNYDSFGNRLNQIESSQAFPSGSGGAGACTPNGSNYTVNSMQYNTANQITYGQWQGQTGGTPGYDWAGNMTSDLTNTYLYDAEGHVCAAQGPTVAGIPGRITGYLYDDEGQRVAKGTLAAMSCDPTLVVNGQPNFTATNVYVLGPSGEQMTELIPNPSTGALQWKHTNVYAAGSLIATYDADTASNTQPLHFQIADWLGTRRVQTDYAGNIEETCTSFAFGDALNCVQTNSATADDATEHHFTNQIHDTESGLDYFGARYYGSNMGRFMSPDWDSYPFPIPYASLENPQTLNLYSYVQNNPLSSRDADGHASYQDCGNGQVCWQGDYNGERDCSGSGGCLFWNQDGANGAGEWQANDPFPPPPGDPAGDAFTGFTRILVSRSFGDASYGFKEMFAGYAGGLQNGPSPLGIAAAVAMPIIRAKRPNLSGKQAANDVPSWAAGSGPQGNENGKQYASRMMDSKYGSGNWSTSSQEYSQLRKYGDRAFVPAEREAAPEPPIEP